LLQVGRDRALAQDIEGAQATFRRVSEMRTGLNIDPVAEAGRVAGTALLATGQLMAESGDIEQAAAAYEKAESLYPGLEIPVSAWNQLCWFGSINGQAERVMHACQRGAEFTSGGEMLDTYAVARALVSDLTGALEGSRAYLEWGRRHGVPERRLARREAWIAELENERNPFDEATQKSLLTE
jgi:hypothetical protein